MSEDATTAISCARAGVVDVVRRSALVLFGAVSFTAVVLRGACGCSSSSSGAGSVDAASTDAQHADAIARDAGYLDSYVPPSSPLKGWTSYSAYDPSCPFFVPSATAYLPPPIQWQACGETGIQPAGIGCKEMAFNWPSPSSYGVSNTPTAWVHDAAVTVLVTRLQNDGTRFLVADVDGSVHTAIDESDTKTCLLNPQAIRDGNYVLSVWDSRVEGKVSGEGGGFIAGGDDSLSPSTVVKFTDTTVHSQIVSGSTGVVDEDGTSTFHAYPWASPSSPVAIWSAAQEHLLLDHDFFGGSAFFFAADSDTVNKEKILKADGGVTDFIAFGNSATEGSGDLGTDGTDMVWLYGSGAQPSAGLYPTVSIMTAPYTTNPAVITPRRLRSEIANGFGVSPFLVGCGYAVRNTEQGERIVRISDGVSWMLPQSSSWNWQSVVAITCDEIFANALAKGANAHVNLVRVRLDSLGPGTAAD